MEPKLEVKKELPRRILFRRRPEPVHAAASSLSGDSGLKMDDSFDAEESGRRSPLRYFEFYGDDAESVDEGIIVPVPVDYISHIEECVADEDDDGGHMSGCDGIDCVCIPSCPVTSDDEDEDFGVDEDDFYEEESDEVEHMNVSDENLDEIETFQSMDGRQILGLQSDMELSAQGAVMWLDMELSGGAAVVPVSKFHDDDDKEAMGSVEMRQQQLLRRKRRMRSLEQENKGFEEPRAPILMREDRTMNSESLQQALDALGPRKYDIGWCGAAAVSSEGSSGRGTFGDRGGSEGKEVLTCHNYQKVDLKAGLEGKLMLRARKRELGPKMPEPSQSLQNVTFRILNIDSEGIFTVYAEDDKLQREYKRMSSRMFVFYSTMCEFVLTDEDVYSGLVVVAETPEGHYFRGVVKRRFANEEVVWEVDCLDEPRSIAVPTGKMHRITESFLAVPRCKMTCELFGLEFFSGRFKMIQNLFQDFIKKEKLEVAELRANIYIFSDYNALEILLPADHEEEEDVVFSRSGYFETVNKAFLRYVYKHLIPKFRVNDPVVNAQFLRFDRRGLAVFQYIGPQLDMVTKLGGSYLKTMNSLKPQTMQSLMKDYFDNHTYIHVIKSNELQVQFQRFKVLDVMHRDNQIFADLVDSGDRVYINISDGVYRADQIHESFVKIPPMFFQGHIFKVDSGQSTSMIAAFLKTRSTKVKLSGYYEDGEREFEVFVHDDDVGRSLMSVTEWMSVCKLQNYLRELRL